MKSVKKISATVVVVLGLIALNTKLFAHCEVPCGIYDDSLRIKLIYEHITTVEKSMNSIIELSKEAAPNYNQLVRWVVNKENHAEKIQEIVSQYFLHQRIKVTDPSDEIAYDKYVKSLTLLHKILVNAMKTKQTTDLSFIEELRKTVHEFEEVYFVGHTH